MLQCSIAPTRLCVIRLGMLLVWASVSAAAESPFDTAREHEEAGNVSAAVDVYREWLADNADSPHFAQVLLRAVELEPSPAAAAELLEGYRTAVAEPADLAKIDIYRGLLTEMLGHIDEAQQIFAGAHQESRTGDPQQLAPSSLINSAALLMELGDFHEAEKVLDESLAKTTESDAIVRHLILLARIYRSTSRNDRAREVFERVVTEHGDRPGSQVAFLELIDIHLTAGDLEGGEATLEQMEERYRDSPEYMSAASLVAGTHGPVVGFVSPLMLFRDLETLANDTGLTMTLQTGAFRDRSNAEHLQRKLRSEGFESQISKHESQDVVLFRVTVGRPASEEAAEVLLERLRAVGYDGFVTSVAN